MSLILSHEAVDKLLAYKKVNPDVIVIGFGEASNMYPPVRFIGNSMGSNGYFYGIDSILGSNCSLVYIIKPTKENLQLIAGKTFTMTDQLEEILGIIKPKMLERTITL